MEGNTNHTNQSFFQCPFSYLDRIRRDSKKFFRLHQPFNSLLLGGHKFHFWTKTQPNFIIQTEPFCPHVNKRPALNLFHFPAAPYSFAEPFWSVSEFIPLCFLFSFKTFLTLLVLAVPGCVCESPGARSLCYGFFVFFLLLTAGDRAHGDSWNTRCSGHVWIITDLST